MLALRQSDETGAFVGSGSDDDETASGWCIFRRTPHDRRNVYFLKQAGYKHHHFHDSLSDPSSTPPHPSTIQATMFEQEIATVKRLGVRHVKAPLDHPIERKKENRITDPSSCSIDPAPSPQLRKRHLHSPNDLERSSRNLQHRISSSSGIIRLYGTSILSRRSTILIIT